MYREYVENGAHDQLNDFCFVFACTQKFRAIYTRYDQNTDTPYLFGLV